MQMERRVVQRDVLRGLLTALEGLGQAPAPGGWSDAYAKLSRSADAEVRGRALVMAGIFGDRQALASIQKTLLDEHASTADRQNALQTLVSIKDPELLPILQSLIADRALRGAALRGLAAYADGSKSRRPGQARL